MVMLGNTHLGEQLTFAKNEDNEDHNNEEWSDALSIFSENLKRV
jgi:hypothetical protein